MEAFVLFAAYLLGSVPFGLVLCKLAGYGDIRQIGSGNIGATNVLRTGSKSLALLTLILDSGKGAFAVWLALYFLDFNAATLAGLGSILGHMFPVWLKFKGGKGVATTLGMMLALVPPVGLLACVMWLVIAASYNISSLAALVSILFTPFMAHHFYGDANLSFMLSLIVLLVWFKHRDNIKRLAKGEEPKIKKREKKE